MKSTTKLQRPTFEDPTKFFEENKRNLLSSLFKKADTDGSKFLDKNEYFRLLMKHLDDDLARPLSEVVFNTLDADKDGKLSEEDFMKIMDIPEESYLFTSSNLNLSNSSQDQESELNPIQEPELNSIQESNFESNSDLNSDSILIDNTISE